MQDEGVDTVAGDASGSDFANFYIGDKTTVESVLTPATGERDQMQNHPFSERSLREASGMSNSTRSHPLLRRLRR